MPPRMPQGAKAADHRAACTRGYFLGEPLHPQPAVRSPGTDQYSHQYVAMTVHAFVDESQRGRFYLVCAVEVLWGLNREVSVRAAPGHVARVAARPSSMMGELGG